MMLWAVLRAIFLPAALVAEGCFRFEFVAVALDDAPPDEVADALLEGAEVFEVAAEVGGT